MGVEPKDREALITEWNQVRGQLHEMVGVPDEIGPGEAPLRDELDRIESALGPTTYLALEAAFRNEVERRRETYRALQPQPPRPFSNTRRWIRRIVFLPLAAATLLTVAIMFASMFNTGAMPNLSSAGEMLGYYAAQLLIPGGLLVVGLIFLRWGIRA